jgi:Zn finger protein HypA/HybF involved in hydrogenase expression
MTLPQEIYFAVGVPTLDGFLGRECNSTECRRHFKVHKDDIRPQMYCPYCGEQFPNDQLWTSAQADYLKRKAAQEVIPLVEKEFRDIFRRAFQGKKGFTFKPGPPIRRRPEPPVPVERPVDSELKCPGCSARFQVDGIFGYCPGCRAENLKLYDANLAIIRQEIELAENPERALRHAYGDLVSTFETFTRKEARRHGIVQGRFQNLEHTRRTFRSAKQIDLFDGFTEKDTRTLKRVFEKRHAAEHNEGIASERYVKEIPEDSHLLGQRLPLSLEELEEAAQLLRRALENLVAIR